MSSIPWRPPSHPPLGATDLESHVAWCGDHLCGTHYEVLSSLTRGACRVRPVAPSRSRSGRCSPRSVALDREETQRVSVVADVGVVGGVGLDPLLDGGREIGVKTPYGFRRVPSR